MARRRFNAALAAMAIATVACAGTDGSSSGTTAGDPPLGSGGSAAGGVPGVGAGGVTTNGGAPTTSGGATPTSGGATGAGGGAGTGTGGLAGSGSAPPALIDGGNHRDSSSDAAVLGAPIPPPAPVGCVTDVTPGVHEFPCDTTTDVVSVPADCVTNACGVIVDVHGGSMSADMEDKNTNLRALGARHGYIVIQPNALPNPLLANARVFVAGEDDVRVMDILDDVTQAFHVDTNRIHMTGFSEGGFMTWRWLCAHSDLLASVAPAAAAWQCTTLPITPEIGCQFTGTDVPARNIPILYMQGMKDALVSPPCVMSWLQGNVFTQLKLGTGTVVAGDATFERTLYQDPAGVPFDFIQHQYTTDSQFFGVAILGHCYPGSTDFVATLPGQLMGFGCKDQCSFNWGEEVIRFFLAHPKQ